MHRYQVCFYADDSKLTLETKINVYAGSRDKALKIAHQKCKKDSNSYYTSILWEGLNKK